jgi:large conductance mechanosensitive channel
MKGFKQFILRGNVLDLAVAVVMGAAFGAVVTAMVKDLLTPLIAAIAGAPDFSSIAIDVRGSKLLVGDFLNAVISFLLNLAAAVYFFIVLPVNSLMARLTAAKRRPIRRRRNVPSAWAGGDRRRCAFCTSALA